jgi:nitroimidazol reductase NimA-like FMN-containing flavoprotein (pyridoxamine 5'-phosphate oxidase superfamily)
MLDQMKKLAMEKDLCVLATVSGGKPHCSLMAYVASEDASEIYMATHKQTKKYRNLVENPSVSLLIDTREEHAGSGRLLARAMTVSGVCEWIRDEGKRALVRARLLERHPRMRSFLDHPDAELLCVRISSFLLLDGLTEIHFEEI